MTITVGSIIEGKVTRITAFGVFVDLGNGISGLVHISEVANAYVRDINEYLSVGDEVKVKVLNADSNNRIGLSIKQTVEQPRPAEVKKESVPVVDNFGFEDKLARFMKDSNEKLGALKKQLDNKKGR